MAARGVTFNTYDLQTATIITTDIDHDTIPAQALRQYSKVRGDGVLITDKRFSVKKIKLVGRVHGTTADNMDSLLDTFRQKLLGTDTVNKDLDIDYNGVTRRYVATCVSLNINDQDGSINFSNFTAEFIATKPYGEDTTGSNIFTRSALTTAPDSGSMTATGSAPEQQITVVVEINSFTGAAVNTITVGNDTTGRKISVSRAWTALEVLTVDTAAFTVDVDGTPVDYTGAFPVFAGGTSQTFIYDDDFTARNVEVDVTHKRRML